MPSKQSAGLLMFRRRPPGIEVLLVHPGGPFWAARDEGAWTIPKGGVHAGETPLDAARREFTEETGFDAPGPFVPLGHVVQRSGKLVHAWAFEGDCDPDRLVSVETTIEWPPRSGRRLTIPEVDRARFFSAAGARAAINAAQAAFVDRLLEVAER